MKSVCELYMAVYNQPMPTNPSFLMHHMPDPSPHPSVPYNFNNSFKKQKNPKLLSKAQDNKFCRVTAITVDSIAEAS